MLTKTNSTYQLVLKLIKGKLSITGKGHLLLKKYKEIDIVFATDNGLVDLSDLEEKGLINNCGWFSRLFRKIAKVAIVVAAPIVAAAIPALAGGAVALSGGVAASAMTASAVAATAVAISAFAVAATSSLTANFIESLSLAVDSIVNKRENYSYAKTITKKQIKAILKQAIKDHNPEGKKNCCLFRKKPRIL